MEFCWNCTSTSRKLSRNYNDEPKFRLEKLFSLHSRSFSLVQSMIDDRNNCLVSLRQPRPSEYPALEPRRVLWKSRRVQGDRDLDGNSQAGINLTARASSATSKKRETINSEICRRVCGGLTHFRWVKAISKYLTTLVSECVHLVVLLYQR